MKQTKHLNGTLCLLGEQISWADEDLPLLVKSSSFATEHTLGFSFICFSVCIFCHFSLSINVCLQCDSLKSTTVLFLWLFMYFVFCWEDCKMAWRAWRWILLNSTGSVSVWFFCHGLFPVHILSEHHLLCVVLCLFLCSRLLPTIEMSEMSVTQSVECPLTVTDTAVVSGHLSTRNGNGAGSISLALRRVLSHSAWAEVINYM